MARDAHHLPMAPEEQVERIRQWAGWCGVPVSSSHVDWEKTCDATDDFSEALWRGWSGLRGEDGGEPLAVSGEDVVCCGEIIARGCVLVLRGEGCFLCFSPRALFPERDGVVAFFSEKRFLWEAVEDCGRALALRPSRRLEACRTGVARASARDGIFSGRRVSENRSLLSRLFNWMKWR